MSLRDIFAGMRGRDGGQNVSFDQLLAEESRMPSIGQAGGAESARDRAARRYNLLTRGINSTAYAPPRPMTTASVAAPAQAAPVPVARPDPDTTATVPTVPIPTPRLEPGPVISYPYSPAPVPYEQRKPEPVSPLPYQHRPEQVWPNEVPYEQRKPEPAVFKEPIPERFGRSGEPIPERFGHAAPKKGRLKKRGTKTSRVKGPFSLG
jgi:hypothetical protein